MYLGLSRKSYLIIVIVTSVLFLVPSIYLILRFVLNINFEHMLVLGLIIFFVGYYFFQKMYLLIRAIDIFTHDFTERFFVMALTCVAISALGFFLDGFIHSATLLHIGINFIGGMLVYYGLVPNTKYKKRIGDVYSFYTYKE